jgi:hypothetical protein
MTVAIICISYLLIGALICWAKYKMFDEVLDKMFTEHPLLTEHQGILVSIFAVMVILIAPIISLLEIAYLIPLTFMTIYHKRETKRLRKKFEKIQKRIESESKRAK